MWRIDVETIGRSNMLAGLWLFCGLPVAALWLRVRKRCQLFNTTLIGEAISHRQGSDYYSTNRCFA